MIQLKLLHRSGLFVKKEYRDFLEFDNWKEFNRYMKKWSGLNFKDLIEIEESNYYKAVLINYRLSNSHYMVEFKGGGE